MIAYIKAVHLLWEQGHIAVRGGKDHPQSLDMLEVRGCKQGCADAVGADGTVIHIIGVSNAGHAGIFNTKIFIGWSRA